MFGEKKDINIELKRETTATIQRMIYQMTAHYSMVIYLLLHPRELNISHFPIFEFTSIDSKRI